MSGNRTPGRRGGLLERRAAADAARESGSNGSALAESLTFHDMVPISRLTEAGSGADWVWQGFFARKTTTLFSALWKVGKTTLLSHLLRAMGGDEPSTFCGRLVIPTRVGYVTEEPEWVWAQRRDKLHLGDHVFMQVRPFRTRPTMADWIGFLTHVRGQVDQHQLGLVVIDPLTTLWPVEKENEAGLVAEALTPLNIVTDAAGICLVHHLRKGDGQELTGSRGSGALMGFVDTILELRRYNPSDKSDRRRLLTGGGRFEETPDELVIELTESGYVCRGDPDGVRHRELLDVIRSVLPQTPPGWTREEVRANWPEDISSPRTETLIALLNQGVEMGLWQRVGQGRKGSPHTFWRVVSPNSFPFPHLGVGNGNVLGGGGEIPD
jgi:hypothetical protein